MEKRYRLPKEFAEKWLAALRSGEYKQGRLLLRSDNDTFCCLGVACAIQGINIPTNKNIGFPKTLLEYETLFPQELPELLLESGIAYNPREGVDNQPNFVTKVARMNDQHKSFPEIADFIEQNCELY